MKQFSLLFVCCVSFLMGCGKRLAEDVEPDQAKQALKTALDAWQSGKTNAELEAQQPSILMNESDWTAGARTPRLQDGRERYEKDGRQVRLGGPDQAPRQER